MVGASSATQIFVRVWPGTRGTTINQKKRGHQSRNRDDGVSIVVRLILVGAKSEQDCSSRQGSLFGLVIPIWQTCRHRRPSFPSGSLAHAFLAKCRSGHGGTNSFLRCVKLTYASPAIVTIGGQLQERREMWSYVQMWSPLLTIVLTTAICLSVVSFIVRQAKPHP